MYQARSSKRYCKLSTNKREHISESHHPKTRRLLIPPAIGQYSSSWRGSTFLITRSPFILDWFELESLCPTLVTGLDARDACTNVHKKYSATERVSRWLGDFMMVSGKNVNIDCQRLQTDIYILRNSWY